MISPARTLSVALAATLLIATCGSDGNDSDATTETDTTATETTVADTTADSTSETTPDTTEAMTEDTTPSTEAPAQDVEADTAAADAALLSLADFPEGWTEAPTDEASEIDALVAECVGGDSAEAAAQTGNFSNPEATLVVHENVDVRADERAARLVMAQVTNPEVPECVAAAYTELGAAALSAGALGEGAEIGEVTATRFAVGAAGNATQAIRVTIPLVSGDAAGQLTVDQVLVRSGRSLATISFEARGEPTPVETIDEITTAAAALLPA